MHCYLTEEEYTLVSNTLQDLETEVMRLRQQLCHEQIYNEELLKGQDELRKNIRHLRAKVVDLRDAIGKDRNVQLTVSHKILPGGNCHRF